MKRVFKYQIKTEDEQIIWIPKHAELLTVQVQNGEPCIWALVDPDEQLEEVIIRTHGTGHEVLDTGSIQYIGTYQLCCGNLVFHVFRKYENSI